MTRAYRYSLLDAVELAELPEGNTGFTVYKDETAGYWGWVEYDHPLSDGEIERYNLDGPVVGWR